jgi:hypothetical protein
MEPAGRIELPTYGLRILPRLLILNKINILARQIPQHPRNNDRPIAKNFQPERRVPFSHLNLGIGRK